MTANFICLACGKEKPQSPRSAGRQSYCGERDCQRVRKAAWQKRSLADDVDHRRNQRLSHQTWCRANPRYWAEYRRMNPEKAKRNRQLQRVRNHRRRQLKAKASEALIAKMDALIASNFSLLAEASEYWLVPVIAKMDALRVKIVKAPDS